MASGTIVLVPGLTCDATFWRAPLAHLDSIAPTVVPLLHDCTSIDDMADRCLAAADGPLHVIGHSMGGRVAMSMARRHPARLASLAILDTGAHPADADEPRRRQVRLDIAEHDGMDALATDWIPNMIYPDRLADRSLVDAIHTMVTSYTVEQYRGQITALLTRADERPTLAHIDLPTLVACGADDAWSPPHQHEEIAAAITGARLEILPDTGHMIAMERPAATTALLDEWLRSVGAY